MGDADSDQGGHASRNGNSTKLRDSFFFSYECEGLVHARRREHEKSVESYTKAINIRPQSATTLVARGWGYVALNKFDEALQDADLAMTALDEGDGSADARYKVLHLKADALYALGSFEFALVNYHRANKLRPDLHAFEYGIQKSTDAIQKCFGTYDPMVETPPFMEAVLPTPRGGSGASTPRGASGAAASSTPRGGASTPRGVPAAARGAPDSSIRVQPPAGAPSAAAAPRRAPSEAAGPHAAEAEAGPAPGLTPHSSSTSMDRQGGARARAEAKRMSKSLLGALHDDRQFLKALAEDEAMAALAGEDIEEGLSYLTGVREYWRQQDPVEVEKQAKKAPAPTPHSPRSQSAHARRASPLSRSTPAASSATSPWGRPSSAHVTRSTGYGISARSSQEPTPSSSPATQEQGPARAAPSPRAGLHLQSERRQVPGRSAMRPQSAPGARARPGPAGGGAGGADSLGDLGQQRIRPKTARGEAGRKQYLDHTRFVLQFSEELQKAVEKQDYAAILRVARHLFTRLPSLRVVNKPHYVADALMAMGSALYELGDHAEAALHLQKALEVASRSRYEIVRRKALVGLASAHMALGRYRDACPLWPQVMHFADTASSARVQVYYAHCLLETGEYEAGVEHSRKGLELAEQLNDRQAAMRAHYVSGECYLKLNNPHMAMTQFEGYMKGGAALKDSVAVANGKRLYEEACRQNSTNSAAA